MNEAAFTIYMMVGAHLVGFIDAKEEWPVGAVKHWAAMAVTLLAWPAVVSFMAYQNWRRPK